MKYLEHSTTPAQPSLFVLLIVTSIILILLITFARRPITHALMSDSTGKSTAQTSSTTLSINGKHIAIPDNGEVQTTLSSKGHTTSINAKSDQRITNKSNHSSTSITITSKNDTTDP